ncbi:MAG: hypothetical protein JWP66_288 [Naasia sp.]|nr:hypothetical protein [Naasia sp.]
MTATPDELAARIEARVRREWPGAHATGRSEFIAPEVRDGGVTDTLLKFVRRVAADEIEKDQQGTGEISGVRR